MLQSSLLVFWTWMDEEAIVDISASVDTMWSKRMSSPITEIGKLIKIFGGVKSLCFQDVCYTEIDISNNYQQ